jgi:superfamily II helicase
MHERPTEPPRMLELTDQQREQLLHQVATAMAYTRQIVEAVLPSINAAAREMAKAFQALQQAGYIDEDGQAVKRPDRPAWISPYGPPPRRR